MAKLKFYIYIPFLLLEKLISLIFGFIYIPFLNFKYGILSMNIDNGRSLSYHEKFKNNKLRRLRLNDVDNFKLRFTLFVTGLFKKWYVYTVSYYENKPLYKDRTNRQVVYLSKKPLKENGLYVYECISKTDLNKKYKNLNRYLKLKGYKGAEEFYKIEPQYYVILGEKPKNYESLMEKSRKRFNKKERKVDTKKIMKCIKNDRLFTSISNWEDKTPLEYCVEKVRYDLIEKILKYTKKVNEDIKVLNYLYERTGEYHFAERTKPIYYAKDDKMFKYLLNKGAIFNKDDYDQMIRNCKGNEKELKKVKYFEKYLFYSK
jgi:hypothetical protein